MDMDMPMDRPGQRPGTDAVPRAGLHAMRLSSVSVCMRCRGSRRVRHFAAAAVSALTTEGSHTTTAVMSSR